MTTATTSGTATGHRLAGGGRISRRLADAVRFFLGASTSAKFSAAAAASILASFFYEDRRRSALMIKVGVGYLWVAKPLLSTLAVVVCRGVDLHYSGDSTRVGESNSASGAGIMTRIIACAFLMSIACNQLPKWLSALVACCAVFAFGLAARQLTPPQQRHRSNTTSAAAPSERTKADSWYRRLGLKEKAVLASIALVASLLIENFVIWVVSATYRPGIDGTPEPLQDNGRIVLENLAMRIFDVDAAWKAKRPLQNLRDGLNIQWALVSSLGASMVCLELRLGQTSSAAGRTLAGLALHALVTLASARLIRTISFVLTVLPSQVANCYARHFPPPPDAWGEWIMVGFLPSARGGCNDLILSGHATVTSTIGCAFTSAASDTSFSVAVWTLIALDYSIESYQGLHYSVDMWLGCVVTCLLWQLTKPVEFGGEHGRIMQNDENGKTEAAVAPPPPPLDGMTVAMYALPAALSFLILTVVPEAVVNYFLVGYSVWVGVIFARSGFTIFLQHVLLCELCFGLGVYL